MGSGVFPSMFPPTSSGYQLNGTNLSRRAGTPFARWRDLEGEMRGQYKESGEPGLDASCCSYM
ncbi:hypothetical protein NQZ68_014456 [Dissostichus eleginoides]|nr:hypothetical protein NQZ68_014456 [Dissostichus eleginoides]